MSRNKKILVTGGLGTIGSPLVKELRKRGCKVIVLDIFHSLSEKTFSHSATDLEPEYVRCDISQSRQLQRVFESMGPFDYVYHCAAEYGRWNGEDYYESLWNTNAVGTKNLIRLQETHRFRLIHFSTSEVYGDFTDVMHEDVTSKYPIHHLNDYALSKWVNEGQIRNSQAHYKTESVIVRLFNIYGPGEPLSPYRSFISRFIYCALTAQPFDVHSNHERTALFIDDAVKTLANIVDHFVPGEIYNIASEKLYPVEAIARMILKLTGASEALMKFLPSEILTTQSKKVDVAKAVNDLKHSPEVILELGLEETIQWMRQQLAAAGSFVEA